MVVIKVVLDTNVLVSAALAKRDERWSAARWVVEAAFLGQRRFRNVSSLPLIRELRGVLMRPGMLDEALAVSFRRSLVERSAFVRVRGVPMGCRDADDDTVLETAMNAEADYLVSGDRDVHHFGSLQPSTFDVPGLRSGPVRIVRLDEFVAVLHEGTPPFSPLIAPELLPATLAA